MRELIVNRHQPEVDPLLHAWGWEIPVDLFFAAVVAGMMILAGIGLLRALRSERGPGVHAPLLAFGLVHICLVALFLDLSHKLYVWNLYLTLQPASPMSWGSWLLTATYGVLALTALACLPGHWPWLARTAPVLTRFAGWLSAPPRLRALAWANLALGTGLVLYTGVLLATMVARPLWNTMVLPPLFLASGLAAGAAMVALAARFVPRRPRAPEGLVGGLLHALVVPLPGQVRSHADAAVYTRYAMAALVAQAILLALYVIGLASGSAVQVQALQAVLTGRFAALFWALVVAAGVIAPLVLLALPRRARLAPFALVLLLAGGLALRWLIVDAGQATRFVAAAGTGF
jgi:formate-dependent nitrite reductase membrane component NrfD